MAVFGENIQMAWLGWKNYTDDGKLAVFLLASLIYLWYYKKKVCEQAFLRYAMVMTISCIVPVTGAVLMVYQTRFYDYEWIWSMVPATAVIACGVTLFLADSWGEFQGDKWRKGLPVTLLLLAALVLAGGMDGQSWNPKNQRTEQERTYRVLESLTELWQGGEVCLWAPREVMEYARETDGRIRLIYGRNMWDVSLNGYAYDSYGKNIIALYEWMEQMCDPLTMDTAAKSLETYVAKALSAGVDCIMLPEEVAPDVIRRMEKALDTEARKVEAYWIFYG